MLSGDCERAFQRLKELLTTTPILKYPDFSRPFILETDVSGCGLGAVLAQEQPDGRVHPIASPAAHCKNMRRTTGSLSWRGLVWSGLSNIPVWPEVHRLHRSEGAVEYAAAIGKTSKVGGGHSRTRPLIGLDSPTLMRTPFPDVPYLVMRIEIRQERW